MEGLADSYYMYNFAHDGSTLNGPQFRNFDQLSNSFSLSYLKLGVGASVENVSFRADIGYGHTGSIINGASYGLGPSYSPPVLTGDMTGGSSSAPANASLNAGLYGASPYGMAFIVQQAFASVTWGQLTLDFGKFTTTAGAEVIESNKNWLYSRSFLFAGIPLLHTGARANFKASDALTLQLSVVNGWNNDPDNNGDKTLGLSANITPNKMLNVIVTAYVGNEMPTGTANSKVRAVVDAVAAITLSDTAGLNLNLDYYKEGDASWFGAAGMGHFVLAEHAALSVRGEFVKSKNNGFAGAADASLFEGTVGLASPWAGHYELRAELRGDFSDKEVFSTGSEAKKNQFTGTLAALAYF